MGRLDGKVAVITGAAGGIGREAALLFSQEGAAVVVADMTREAGEKTAAECRDAIFQEVDVSDAQSVSDLYEAAARRYGGVDVLYNNASLPRFAPFPEMSVEDFQFTVRNEVDLLWYTTQAAWPHLVESPTGNVVNIASIAALVGLRGLPQSAHALAKGAVIGLTAQLAAEGAPVGIRVNCISPGVINSPPVQEILSVGPESPLAGVIGATALGKPGEAEDIVYAALYFASDEARWTTGSHLVVDGGSSVLI
jgi:NAD(P)-dependent dehydrogenase (short-subunit alcohol dehydrogenase family)